MSWITRFTFVVAVLGILALAFIPPPLAAEGMDVLVMVDTSESMFPYFDDLVKYLIRDILEERLRPGDSFHLLSFAGEPEIEVGVGIDDNFSVEKIIGRILLLQPLGPYTDLVSAIQYLYTYAKVLPEKNRKTILLLTDGIHDPPPGSPYYGWDSARIRADLLANAKEIQREGWSVHILQIPMPGVAGAAPAKTPASQATREDARRKAPGGVGGSGKAAAAGGKPSPGAGSEAVVAAPAAPAGTPPAAEDGAGGPAAAAGKRPAGAAAAAGAAGERPSAAGGGEARPADRRGVEGAGAAQSREGGGPASGEAGGLSFLEDLARALDTEVVPYDPQERAIVTSRAMGLPLLKFPGHLGRVGRLFTAPFEVQNFLDEPIILRLTGVRARPGGGRSLDLLARKVTVTVPARGEAALRVPLRLPGGQPEGPVEVGVELIFSEETYRVSPRHGTLQFTYSPGILGGRFLLMGLLYAALAAVVLYCLLRLLMAVRLRIEAKPAAPFRRAVEAAAGDARPIIMNVFFRELKMADKAVHSIRPGTSRSVGGSGSAFAVHSLPLPRRIADLANENAHYVFHPRRPAFLPGIEAPIRDCLDRTIEVAGSRPGQRLRLVFHEYVSPLEEINKLMLSIRRPDIPPRAAKAAAGEKAAEKAG